MVVADTCIVVTPILPDLANGVLMTNSGKFAHYAPGNTGYGVIYASLADCVESAVAGRPVISGVRGMSGPAAASGPGGGSGAGLRRRRATRWCSPRRSAFGAASIRRAAASPTSGIPQCGSDIAGTVLFVPGTIGSSSAAAVLLELVHASRAPAALVLHEPDAILLLGLIVAREMGWPTPVAVKLDRTLHAGFGGRRVVVGADGQMTA